MLRFWLSSRRNTRQQPDDGTAIVIAIVAVALLITSALLLATRSSFFFSNSLKSSYFKNAREVAEFGASELTSELNKDGNSYLLVTQPACWQSMSVATLEGFYLPADISTGTLQNRITGVATNSDTSKQWRTIGSTSSGNYARYQLINYQGPTRTDQLSNSTPLKFGDSCPGTTSDRFANRYGGTGFLTIAAELYRKGTRVAQHTITQQVHVKGSLASSSGETALVLIGNAELDTAQPWLDYNNNGSKDTNEPWIDIFCVYCTGTTQTQLKTSNAPIGVGFQGTMANNYTGTILKGSYIFPKFRFEDKNNNGLLDSGENPYPIDLYNALIAKPDANWQGSPDNSNRTFGDTASIGYPGTATGVPLYKDEAGTTNTGATVELGFCDKNENKTPCNKDVDGDLSAVTRVSGGLTTSDLTNSGGKHYGYIKPSDVCALISDSKPSGCSSSTLIRAEIIVSATGTFSPPDLTSPLAWYPYISDPRIGTPTYRNECADAVDPVNGKSYIGCVVNSINFQGGGSASIDVRTDLTGGKPVYLYIQKISTAPNDSVLDFGGNQSLNNAKGDDPSSLAVFGLPPLTNTPTSASCDQRISLSGTESFEGIWAWLPRGGVLTGTGTAGIKGLLWVCDFNGNGTFNFMGSKYNPGGGDCGINQPCGLYKYRAQGIARVDRVSP